LSNGELVSWLFSAASLFYLAGIATYLVMRRRTDKLPPAANFILGFLCAIAGGFCAYFFTGQLGLDFEVPGTNIHGNAAGGIAVFALVILLWIRYEPNQASNVSSMSSERSLEAIARVLTDLEDVWKTVSAIKHGRTPNESVTHQLVRESGRSEIRFTEVGSMQPLQVLTIDEVRQRLSDDEQRLLLDTEASMKRKVDAWHKEAALIDDPAAANLEEKKRLLRIAAGMSNDLNAIFGAIERTLTGALQDHYSAERWIAATAAGLLQELSLEEAGPIEREFGE
jgi:hypothetical protein